MCRDRCRDPVTATMMIATSHIMMILAIDSRMLSGTPSNVGVIAAALLAACRKKANSKLPLVWLYIHVKRIVKGTIWARKRGKVTANGTC